MILRIDVGTQLSMVEQSFTITIVGVASALLPPFNRRDALQNPLNRAGTASSVETAFGVQNSVLR